ncbi:hypothetical protein EVAR_100559_1 [Eumeta japonica]|uniref:Uncharacterized protein n=1 Tax=Eumeta variegata TaxID=151549 RepID=A0A4C2A0Q3_EUMVA|nr:hypothetical protein EVAR_100559_1 [Eumeta japonica]
MAYDSFFPLHPVPEMDSDLKSSRISDLTQTVASKKENMRLIPSHIRGHGVQRSRAFDDAACPFTRETDLYAHRVNRCVERRPMFPQTRWRGSENWISSCTSFNWTSSALLSLSACQDKILNTGKDNKNSYSLTPL